MNNKIKLSFTLLILLVSLLWGDAGILVPANVNDPNAIGIKDMEVIISMDNQFVKTQVIQIYKNNIKLDVEGEYKFVIPEEAAISNFAIWEDGVRIEGVIMEKTKAREIYEDLTWQKIDPGLMESATEIEQINVFTVKVYPIPAFGTKRVEIEYTQNLDINSMKSYYTLPLKPSIMQEQFVDDFNLDMYMVTDYPIGELKFTGERLIPELRDDTTGVKHYNLQIRKLKMEENFSFSYDILTEDIYANLLAFRDVETIYRDVAPDGGKNYQDTTGYFSFKMIYNLPQKSDSKNDYKQVLFLFDNSLSMKWDKLQQAYQALVYFLNRLNKDDKFNVGLFSYDTDFFSNGFVVASQDNLESAQAFVRNNFMLGGTDLGKALTKTLEMAGNAENTDIILISDGHPTLKNIDYNKILKDLNAHKKQSKTKIYTFGIGNDTNISFLKKLADNFNGYFNWVGDTEDLDFKVPLFYDKLDLTSVIIDKIDFGSNGNIFQVYPEVLNRTYNQSSIDLVGKYKEPQKNVNIKFSGEVEGSKLQREYKYNLPEKNTEHPFLRRNWAKRRVDWLVDKIRMEGEDENLISEIINLSKQFKFVTPYTSFLAAPRSLLRPRVIKPGDPILRVKTDPAIIDVIAVFPFGLIKHMTYLENQDIWETRFLAPKWMNDGDYTCKLFLKDKNGNQYVENKEFVIDSRPPEIKLVLEDKLKTGSLVKVKAYADKDTRTLKVSLPYSDIVDLRYDHKEKASVGYLRVPQNIMPGEYKLKVWGEDFAHNTTVNEVTVQIVGS